MKSFFPLLIFFLFATCQTSRYSYSPTRQQIEYMKNYFFCRCLEHAYPEEVTKKLYQNDISQGVLFDVGDLGKYYQVLDSLAVLKAKSIKPSQISDYQNKAPVIMRCLKFRRNLDIREILKK